MLESMYNSEFVEKNSEKEMMSMNDKKILDTMESSVKIEGKHYVLPLQAEKICISIKRKMLRDTEFMNMLIEKGFARLADRGDDQLHGKIWYIPHQRWFGSIHCRY